MLRRILSVWVLMLAAGPGAAAEPDDPFIWLEAIDSEPALAWVKAHNLQTTKELEAQQEYQPIHERTLAILSSKERIATPSLFGVIVYNSWQDEQHERGIWRRTKLESYRTAEPQWETVIDVDALAGADKTPWVFKSASCLPPEHRRCMVALSRGGGDAVVQREFDTVTKSFVKDGFSLPEAKSRVDWRDADTLWVGTDFGVGSLTTSGYPRLVKLWKRGTPLDEAKTVFAGEPGDVASSGASLFTPEGRYDLITRVPAFFRSESYLVLADRLVKLDLPADAELELIFKERLLISLRSDWTVGGRTYPADALLAIGLDDFLRGRRGFDVLFVPSPRSSRGTVKATRDRVVLTSLEDVHGRLSTFTLSDGEWKREEIPLPGIGAVSAGTASDAADVFFFTYEDFLTPSSLFLADAAKVEKVKSLPAFFAAAGMKIEQAEAVSRDGTKIPYFLVTPAGFKADGTTPALLYGYGGFEVPELPTYNARTGAAWLERGGVYALANIRGGGEFGPRWHNAALKENRIKSFEDFIAVAEDLIARKITSPRHLGIMGGSQGGLLVGGAFTMRPELFNAVVVQVPLADMKRFSHLLAGASWMAEYGNPDVPEDWAYIQTWSPFHLLRKEAKYPVPFFWTNTRDDRVHPGHARKMVARMEAQNHPVYYFENIEGGHGSGAVIPHKAYVTALEYAYLWKMLQ
ncbi:MAG: prolyl oligopeptidase family serine peptidase [Acidobacteriota bacterium]